MNEKINNILEERFSADSLISIATVDNYGMPWVRIVDAIYIYGAFYCQRQDERIPCQH